MSLRLFNSEPFFGLRQFNRIFDDALRGRATPALWAMNGFEPATFMPRQVHQRLASMTTASADLLTLSQTRLEGSSRRHNHCVFRASWNDKIRRQYRVTRGSFDDIRRDQVFVRTPRK